jgi:hypothetical protein
MSDFRPPNNAAKGWVLYDGECGLSHHFLKITNTAATISTKPTM